MSTEIDPRLLVSPEKKPEEQKSIWSKNEKRLLHLFAVLGLINFFAYFLTQSSYVMQNIYWVYGFLTLADLIAFVAGLAIVDSRVHKKSSLPERVKTFIVITGLWLISVPVVVIQYYYPVISINLVDIANFLWGASLFASGMYEALYFGVILMYWLTKGMELQ